jgi:hypothetical protein
VKIGDEVKTTRGWSKAEVGSQTLRPFSDCRKYFAELFAKVDDDAPCMFQIVVKFPPRKLLDDSKTLAAVLGREVES